MFLKNSGFKKLINEAYKGAGLKAGNDGEGYYLHGGYWTIWIRKGCISKKGLASIIELTGELPEPGTGFEATKAGNQYEMQWRGEFSAWENANTCDEEAEITPLTLKYSTGQQARILQKVKDGQIILINERFIEMVDNTEVEYKDGETQAVGPLTSRKYPGVFWINERMALHVYPRTDDENRNLIKYIEAFDIMSRGENRDEYRLLGHGVSEANEEEETEEA